MKTLLVGVLLATPALAAAQAFPKDGEAIYRQVCQGCHMADAKGAEGAGRYPALAGNPRLAANTYPVQVVLQGRHGMPAFGPFLDDSQVAGVVNYVRTHFGNTYSDTVTPEDVKTMRPQRLAAAALVAAATTTTTPAAAGDLVRHRTPGSDFPILMAVEVPAGYKTIYLSGVVPSVADATKPAGTLDAYGDTRTQTVSVLKNIERNLQRLKLSNGRAHENAPARQAAMAVVKGVESRPVAGAAAEASSLEMSLRSLEGTVSGCNFNSRPFSSALSTIVEALSSVRAVIRLFPPAGESRARPVPGWRACRWRDFRAGRRRPRS